MMHTTQRDAKRIGLFKIIKNQGEYIEALNRVDYLVNKNTFSLKTEKELEELVLKIKIFEGKIMSYVIFENTSTYLFKNKKTRKECYATWGAARAAMTRNKLDERLWSIAESTEFHSKIEKTKIVHNLMSGEPVELPVNTPRCCDPSTELYWSM